MAAPTGPTESQLFLSLWFYLFILIYGKLEVDKTLVKIKTIGTTPNRVQKNSFLFIIDCFLKILLKDWSFKSYVIWQTLNKYFFFKKNVEKGYMFENWKWGRSYNFRNWKRYFGKTYEKGSLICFKVTQFSTNTFEWVLKGKKK